MTVPPYTMSTFEVAAKARSLAPFRKKLRFLLEAAPFDSKTTHDVLLSVDEILTNVIRHSYGAKDGRAASGKILVSFSNLSDRIEIVIEDQGPSFDPRKMPPPSLPSKRPGGLGIHLVRSLMDEMDHESLKPTGNRLRLVKYKKSKERKDER